MKNMPSSFQLAASKVRAIVVTSTILTTGLCPAAVIYESDNFADLSAWSFVETGSASATVVSGGTPTGSDTSRLHLLNSSVNSENPNNPSPDALTASLDLGSYTGADPVRITFDLQLVQVMIPDSDTAATNGFRVDVKSSGGTTLVGNQFFRYSGGGSASAIGFGNSDGFPVSGYVDVTSWYHVVIDLPGVGSSGNAVMTVSGLDGATVHDGNPPFGAVPSVTVIQTAATGLTNYDTLSFKAGNSWGDFSVDASITNLSVITVPEPSTATTLGIALVGVAMVRLRRRIRLQS